jgi:hypothetical protein
MLRLSAIILLLVANSASPAFANPAWTFCVASALGTKDVWVTSLFQTGGDRTRLEEEFKILLERNGGTRIVTQCPQPSNNKVAVVNAQTTAEDFNRKLGVVLHDIPLREFSPR